VDFAQEDYQQCFRQPKERHTEKDEEHLAWLLVRLYSIRAPCLGADEAESSQGLVATLEQRGP
jgi:hypothetical protein